MMCALNGDLRMMRYLIKRGIQLNQIDHSGNSELYYSVKSNNFKKEVTLTTKIFLEYFKKENLLLSSLYLKNKEVSKLLIEKNINLLFKDKTGTNSLIFIINYHIENLLVLIKFKFEKKLEEMKKIYSHSDILEIQNRLKPPLEAVPKKKHTLKICKPFIPNMIQSQLQSTTKDKSQTEILKELGDSLEVLEKRIASLSHKNRQISKLIKQKEEIKRHDLIYSNPKKCLFSFLKLKNQYSSSLYYNLGKEIKLFSSSLKGFEKGSNKFFDEIYKNLKHELSRFFNPNVIIDKSGSYKTNLRMPWSNLNIIISLKNLKNNDKKLFEFKNKIDNFYEQIKNNKNHSNVKLETRQSLKILTFVHNDGKFKTEIEILFKFFINNYFPSNEKIILNYLKEFPEIKIIYQIFRSVLRNFKLDNPAQNGLNSICILLIVIYFFQKREKFLQKQNYNQANLEERPKENTRSTLTKETQELPNNYLQNEQLGKLLVDFFGFYNEFNFDQDVIRTDISGFPKKNYEINNTAINEESFFHKKDFMVIFHPYKNNIILSKSFKYTLLLKDCFKFTYFSFFSDCNCIDHNTSFLFIKKKKCLISKKMVSKDGIDIHVKFKKRNNANRMRSFTNFYNVNKFSSQNIEIRKNSLNFCQFEKMNAKIENNFLLSNDQKAKTQRFPSLFNIFNFNKEPLF